MKVVLIRHGESIANFENYWTGWLDVPLTKKGEEQAKAAGNKIKMAQLVDLSVSMMNVSVPTQQEMSHRKPSQYFQRYSAYNHDC